MSESTATADIQQSIRNFLQERLQPKLEKLKENETEKRDQLVEDHQPQRWISNAAKRVGQIQQVTHALKFTHPDARGTSLNALGNAAAGDLLVGTHLLHEPAADVVGNAAALDVYKFLKLEIGGKTILDLALQADPALEAAFSEDAEEARDWMTAFAGLVEPKGSAASHRLAKQIYWPTGQGEYHLLSPLFPSSLVHHTWNLIREDRFGEAAKAARGAFRNREPHTRGFCEYPDLAVQNFGGTKPQNISQLNCERRGENYLLAALPPLWHSDPIRPPLFAESVFDRLFPRRPRVRRQLPALRDFLASVKNDNNVRIRNTRAQLVDQLSDEVLLFAAEIHSLEPGWSREDSCRLNSEEQCWLDPGRAAQDEAFAALYARDEWKEKVCKRFANWLNAQFTSTKTPMGEPEANAWQDVLEKAMERMQRELGND